MATPNRGDRIADLAALLLIIAGIALYLDGTRRLTAISSLTYRHPGARGVSALHAADLARWTANGGIALAVAGCLLGIAIALRAHRRTRAS